MEEQTKKHRMPTPALMGVKYGTEESSNSLSSVLSVTPTGQKPQTCPSKKLNQKPNQK